jgi:glutamate-5-semialdehyde dehydrogenase
MALDMQQLGQQAKAAARHLRGFDTAAKNRVILAIADELEAQRDWILAENAKDVAQATEAGLSYAIIDRLNLQKHLTSIIEDVRKVADLPDPVGREYDHRVLAEGLTAHRRRVPIGVIGAIFESRPNVTVDVAVLALKTSNATILRGGSETLRSNIALVNAIQKALEQHGFPPHAVQLISDTNREYVAQLLKLHQYVDVIIPRGGASLHEFCREHSTIPVITGGVGICHLYIDETADLPSALEVIMNSKTRRPAACNTVDTLLVKRHMAESFLPLLIERAKAQSVTLKLDAELAHFVNGDERIQLAQSGDWDIEWLDYILGIKVVADLEEAIEHIEAHGTSHSDGILTQDPAAAAHFLNSIDSAAVFVNAATGFNDGSALGLGAEVASSTQKIHGRGPIGLEELTIYKWIVQGEGHTRTR